MAQRAARQDIAKARDQSASAPLVPIYKKGLLSVGEAAVLSCIGRTLFYRLCEANEVPTVRIGERVLIKRCDLEQWWASLQTTPYQPRRSRKEGA